jgi:hypothetical protein
LLHSVPQPHARVKAFTYDIDKGVIRMDFDRYAGVFPGETRNDRGKRHWEGDARSIDPENTRCLSARSGQIFNRTSNVVQGWPNGSKKPSTGFSH